MKFKKSDVVSGKRLGCFKKYICSSDSYINESGFEVVELLNEDGYFDCDMLEKVYK